MSTVSDNFNRASEFPIGFPWTVNGGNAPDLVGNQLESTIQGDSYIYYDSAATGFDQFSQASEISPGITSHDWGPSVRVGGASHSFAPEGYTFDAYQWNAGGFAGLVKHVTGSFTQLTDHIPAAYAFSDVLRIEASGTTIKGYRNGTLLTTVTDSSLSVGQPGLFFFDTPAGSGGGVDNWSGGDLSGGVVNVNRSVSFSAAASTTATRRKGVARLTALTPSSPTVATRLKNILRAVSFGPLAPTTTTRSKGFQRPEFFLAPSTTTSSRLKDSPRTVSLLPSVSTTTFRTKGFLRAVSVSAPGSTPFSHTVTTSMFNVSRAISFLGGAITAIARSVGVARTTSLLAPSSTSSVRLKDSPRSTSFTPVGSTTTVRTKQFIRSVSISPVGLTSIQRSVSWSRAMAVSGGGVTSVFHSKGLIRSISVSGAGETLTSHLITFGAVASTDAPAGRMGADVRGGRISMGDGRGRIR